MFLTILTLTLTSSSFANKPLDWWQHASFYQIYPRSFKDDNNDGIGDLQGVIDKIDHFPNTGITAFWLSPIFESPQVDQGYDISNYTIIDPSYGTNDVLKTLTNEAHSRNVKVMLDFVPNHTSDKHPWFINSVNGVDAYKDYYVWVDAKIDSDGKKVPPNNWLSRFKNSAWEWNEKRQQYYLHQFTTAQPDLNYRNPKVVDDMTEVLKFWLDFGIDGFRIDAAPFIFEDKDLRDEPQSNTPGLASNDYRYLNHTYTQDAPETFELIYYWRKFVDDYVKKNGGETRVLMTEAYTDIKHTMLYYGSSDGTKLGAHFSYNFFLITDLFLNSTAQDIVDCVNRWLKNKPKMYTSNWVLGNHDQPRVATRLGPQNVDGFNMLTSLLPGVDITYNGEEIGQENGEVSFEERQDPNTKNRESFEKESRDFERTPYQWDDSVNAGFNTGAKPWLPVSKEYLKTNLKRQQKSRESHYKVFQALAKIRKDPVLIYGDVEIRAVAEYVVLVKRTYGRSCVALHFNKGDKKVVVDVAEEVSEKNEIKIKSVDSTLKLGTPISINNLNLGAHEALVVSFSCHQ